MYSKDEYKQLKTNFWTSFSAYTAKNRKRLKLPQRPYYILYNTKIKGVELKFDLRRDSVDVAIEVNGWGREEMFSKVKAFAPQLQELAAEITSLLPDIPNISPLITEHHYLRETGVEVSRIYIQLIDIDFHRQDQWPIFYQFMALSMSKFQAFFLSEMFDILSPDA